MFSCSVAAFVDLWTRKLYVVTVCIERRRLLTAAVDLKR